MRFSNTAFLLASAIALTAVPASAALVAGGDPTGTLQNGNYLNTENSQNFLVRFTLSEATELTGMSILAGTGFWQAGVDAHIKIRSDLGGSPTTANLFSFNDGVDALSTYMAGIDRVTVNFSGVTLAAGSYWIGLSRAGSPIGTWASFNNGGVQTPTYQRQLYGDSIDRAPGIYDLAYSLYGEAAAGAVPEPASWALMIGGFGLVGAALRRRRTSVAFA